MFRRHVRRYARRPRREVHWIGSQGAADNVQISGASQTSTFLTQAILDSVGNRDSVFERFVGSVVVSNLDTTQQAGCDVYFGLFHYNGEVTQDTVPTFDPSLNSVGSYGYWLHRRMWRLGSIGGNVTALVQQAPTSNQYFAEGANHYFDIRVKRKLRAGSTIGWTVKSLGGGGGNTIDVRPLTRFLISTR